MSSIKMVYVWYLSLVSTLVFVFYSNTPSPVVPLSFFSDKHRCIEFSYSLAIVI